MNRWYTVFVIVLPLLITEPAIGQLTIIDDTRSVSATATGTFGPTQNPTDSTTVTGNYSKALTAAKTDTTFDQMSRNNFVYNAHANASQISVISGAGLSGTGNTGGDAATGTFSSPFTTVEGVGVSIYNVNFSVPAPTAFFLTGNIGASGFYHPGPLEVSKANVTLTVSGQAQPLYTVSQQLTINVTSGLQSFTDPVDFSTILQPGLTYTLNAQASADSFRIGGVGISISAPTTATYTFTATVPEPFAVSFLLPALLLVSRFRRRRSVILGCF